MAPAALAKREGDSEAKLSQSGAYRLSTPRSKQSSAWLKRHFADRYVLERQRQGLRSRAWFKLDELCKAASFIVPGSTIIDLGSAPGGWSQCAAQRAGRAGQVIACDLLEMPPLPGVEFIRGDFTDPAIYQQLLAQTQGRKVSVVLSDMSPNLSGHLAIDQPKILDLMESVLEFVQEALRLGGSFVVKGFQGDGIAEYGKCLKRRFREVAIRKPSASRQASREIYFVAKGFQGK